MCGWSRTPRQAELLQGGGLPEELGVSCLARPASKGWRAALEDAIECSQAPNTFQTGNPWCLSVLESEVQLFECLQLKSHGVKCFRCPFSRRPRKLPFTGAPIFTSILQMRN